MHFPETIVWGMLSRHVEEQSSEQNFLSLIMPNCAEDLRINVLLTIYEGFRLNVNPDITWIESASSWTFSNLFSVLKVALYLRNYSNTCTESSNLVDLSLIHFGNYCPKVMWSSQMPVFVLSELPISSQLTPSQQDYCCIIAALDHHFFLGRCVLKLLSLFKDHFSFKK